MREIVSFPVWDDCPFRSLVPEMFEIRRGFDADLEQHCIIIYHPTWSLFVCFSDEDEEYKKCSLEQYKERILRPCLNNIVLARFEQEYPGEQLKMPRRKVEAILHGKKFDSIEQAMYQRYDELQGLAA